MIILDTILDEKSQQSHLSGLGGIDNVGLIDISKCSSFHCLPLEFGENKSAKYKYLAKMFDAPNFKTIVG